MLFVLVLFALFALSGIALIVLGADVYERNTSRMEDNYALRTAGAYLTEKIRRTDASGSVMTGEIDGIPALLLREYINDISYTTCLYLYEGQLTELFARSDLDLPASAGTPVLALEDVRFSFSEDNLLHVRLVETGGRAHELFLNVRPGKEAPDE